MRMNGAVAVLALLLAPAGARTQGAADTTRLALDPQVITGTLPNGLRYYVRENHRPEKRAELRLAVNAGSALEDADQLGLAHFTEHMAFNGTRHFEKNALVEYMRSIGMRWGPELNAYTSYDETVYMLTLPTDTGAALTKGIQVLNDWAVGQLDDTTEIRKERGVILEEWRLRRGAATRIRDRQLSILYGGSRYAERDPIGASESITGFDPRALVRFYHDWYRPDLMAVIAVGDFDGKKVEAMIRESFGAIPRPARTRERTVFTVPGVDSMRYAIVTDKEATSTTVAVHWRIPVDSIRTVADYRRELIERIYMGMLSMRLGELAQKADPPFIGAAATPFQMVRGDRTFVLTAAVTNGGEARGLDALLTEAERVRRHGFTADELTRQSSRLLRGLEQMYAERDKTESAAYASQYVANFLRQSPVPGIDATLALTRRLLPGITLAEVNAVPAGFLGKADRVVMLSAPEKPDVAVATPAQLAAVFGSLEGKTIEPYRDELADAPLVPALPTPAAIVSERPLPEVTAREIRLGNGVRVILKATDFKADQVLFQAYSFGGTSLLSVRDARQAMLPLALAGGLGRFSQIDLAKVLSGKVARVFPMISEVTQGVTGSASPRDLETVLALTYLTLTSPRVDSAAFASVKQRLRASLENRGAMPEMAFMDTLGVVLAQHSPRRAPVTAATIDSLQYGDVLRTFRERFADPGALTFVFVGSFNVDSLRPLLVKYLGALPSLKRNERAADVLPETPAGIVKSTIRKGMEQKSQVAIVFSGPLAFSPGNTARLGQLAALVREHLLDVVREELGGTYGLNANATFNRLPRPRYQFSIGFGCAPDRVDELTGRIFKELDRLRTLGPDTADVRKLKEEARRTREVALKDNGWWLNQLYAASVYEWPFATIPAGAERIETISARTIQDAARRYLNPDRYVQVVLLPAGTASATPR